jgi:hypothetical protein
MNVDYNPHESLAVEGRPGVVTVRGRVMVRDGMEVPCSDVSDISCKGFICNALALSS